MYIVEIINTILIRKIKRFRRFCIFRKKTSNLLRNKIQEDLNERIEKIRREAYNLGWKQAKSKKQSKKTWFNGKINSDHI